MCVTDLLVELFLLFLFFSLFLSVFIFLFLYLFINLSIFDQFINWILVFENVQEKLKNAVNGAGEEEFILPLPLTKGSPR